MNTVYETDLPLPGRRRGKVRDIYEIPAASGPEGSPPALLIVATDRVSAFDVVMPTPIPGKGRLLTDISTRWFRFIEQRGLARTHLISTDPADIKGLTHAQREDLEGRITIGRRCRVVPIECVARGYIAGSGWAEYKQSGTICGVRLPEGLQRGDSIIKATGAPIFTPATKEEEGHDENIDFARACSLVGEGVMTTLRDLTITMYAAAHEYALTRGLILADTKFEFGFPVDEKGEVVSDEPLLIDEALTPDSSRYWPADGWTPGREQVSMDKQYLREHLETLVNSGAWDKTPPGPELPDEIVRNTLAKYEQARDILFGDGDGAANPANARGAGA
ncbi:MAG: phosphoribosylaminoimidazolesuccinocarboxamide synthase [Phycisphaerales bacterium]|nr:MAG: phosphoribosylaminoimidazolesuccinocarboxamide synthase [Phycisphaerales bacterium]